MVEADRAHPPGQAPRTAQGGLDLRLQLRRTQPDAAPTADRAKTSARPQGAVRLKPAGNGLPQGSRCPENTRKTLASNQFHRSEGTNPPVETHPYAEFQQVLRAFAGKSGLKMLQFEAGLELRVAHPNKGDAVSSILEGLPPDVKVAYLGDDLTDEDAFHTLTNRGLTVLVRRAFRETC